MEGDTPILQFNAQRNQGNHKNRNCEQSQSNENVNM